MAITTLARPLPCAMVNVVAMEGKFGMTTGPLTGIRVVELSTMITASSGGMLLADMGADVVKVENPKGGDPFRSFGTSRDYSAHFCSYNRNKRSVALDLRSEHGQSALKALLSRADVLLENFRPGVLDRLGFDAASLEQINPRLIHCSITGFGPDGPYAQRPSYNAVAQSLAGMSSLLVDADNPRMPGPTIADNVCGAHAAAGILAAIVERERTGKARRVEINMIDSTLAFMPDPFGYHEFLGVVADPYTSSKNSQSYAVPCGEGSLLCIHLSSQPQFWEGLVKALDLQEFASDPRVGSRMLRIEHYDLIADAMSARTRTMPRQHWMRRLEENDVPFAPILDVTEVPEDAQVQHLGSFATLEHPEKGRLRAVMRPIWLDGTRQDQPMKAPPLLGEHTAEVMAELGLPTAPEKS
jgi:crotonobetainyl-CoA:carnitine CoA-transferase CaiB-like acyl-CoA transferase